MMTMATAVATVMKIRVTICAAVNWDRALGEAAGQCADAEADDRGEKYPAPSDAVGEGDQQQRGQRAEPDHTEELAELRFADLEIDRDVLERRGQHRGVVLLEEYRQ